MSILDTIKSTLETLAADSEYPMSGGVYYGVCTASDLPEWNYFVFNRRETDPANDMRYADYFEIHIIHEDYIAEGYELEVEKAIKTAIPRCSLAEKITYDYIPKGDTRMVVEIANLTFKKTKKVG